GDAGPEPEPGDHFTTAARAVSLDFEETDDLSPAGDRDCYAFEVSERTHVTLATETSNCGASRTVLRLYAADATDPTAPLLEADAGTGQANCALLETTLEPGDYVVCTAEQGDDDVLLGVR